MILSRYTEFIDGKDNYIYLFSCLNRKWIKMDIELANIVISHKKDIHKLSSIHPELFETLTSEKFIVDSHEEDIENCINFVSSEYLANDYVNITINPTLDCNLRCWYCYEKRHAKSVMSKEVMHNTITFIKNLLVSHKVKGLRLSFFGGEPLLHFNEVVHPIIEQVQKLCMQTETQLSLGLTTNGFLLSDLVLAKLQSFSNDTNIQVAFDGNKSHHDKIKFLANGTGCYDRTVKNVKNAISKGFNVTVRCNYDKKTIASFFDVVTEFKDYHSFKNLRFLFQKIWQENEDKEMQTLRKELVTRLDQNFIINSNLHYLLGNSLHRCYADHKNNVVINYDGLVFRCTARKFEIENSLGKLTSNGCELTDTFSPEETIPGTNFGVNCKECRILPICPCCSQSRIEHGLNSCPINVTELDMVRNIRAAFHDLSRIKADIAKTPIL